MPAEWIRNQNSRVAPLATQAELDELPEAFDWRESQPPVVTPVKNQGKSSFELSLTLLSNFD